MGRAIASALLGAGHDVTAFDRTRAKTDALIARGAKIVSSAAHAIQTTDRTILVL